MMEYWFAGTGRNKDIDIDVIKNLSNEAKSIIASVNESVANEEMFKSDANLSPRSFLLSNLLTTINQNGVSVLVGGGDFDHISTERRAAGEDYMCLDEKDGCEGEKKLIDMHWIQEYLLNDALFTKVEYLLLGSDEYTAAFNEAVLRLLAKGRVTLSDGSIKVTVTGLALYFRDTYDFRKISQDLGCWSLHNPFTSRYKLDSGWTCVSNSSFREYNSERISKSENEGKDFRIFSTLETIHLNDKVIEFTVTPEELIRIGVATTAVSTTTTTSSTTTSTIQISTTVPSTTTTTLQSGAISENISYPLSLEKGWNLLGNSLNQSVAVTELFGDANVVNTAWKWDRINSGWQFYTPAMDEAALLTYAASKGYIVLTEIKPGDGYWVNAKVKSVIGTQSGVPFKLSAAHVLRGWNLLATGENVTPSVLNRNLTDPAVEPPKMGVVPLNVSTIWAWSNVFGQWYFYAPSLDAQGDSVLSDYVLSKGYLGFTQHDKTLGNGIGFWINR